MHLYFPGLCAGLCLLLSCYSHPLTAQTPGLFDEEGILKITLETDMAHLLADRGEAPHDHDAVLTYKPPSGKKLSIPIELRCRGNFRRDPRNCIFPPLHVKFKKRNALNTLFEGNKKLKLVTHCQEESSVIKEYMIYKAYNLLTPMSFRVRLVKITYKCSSRSQPPEQHLGFFIEDANEVARRNGGHEMSEQERAVAEVDQQAAALMYLFNAMVGNTDWDIGLAKNLKFIEFEDGRMPVAVPYDFDWCAAVGASYTRMQPADYEPMRYRSLCNRAIDFDSLIQVFMRKKPALHHLYLNTPYLSRTDAQKMLAYFEEFYSELKKPGFVQEKFFKACEAMNE
ncbi:MAG: hypothetical protein D6730_12280 [Bacteroidetes bacterium]|nr:MAG: hypothetical protein D6730_12280 [Bacteroidota bacterium]